jgi:hypothetical protein
MLSKVCIVKAHPFITIENISCPTLKTLAHDTYVWNKLCSFNHFDVKYV